MVDFALNTVVIATLVAVHEAGHYAAGRAIGIPGSGMRIMLFQWPPHVALRPPAAEWIAPMQIDRYVDVLNRYANNPRDHFVFVGGGHGAEWLAVVGLTGSALAIDHAMLLAAAERVVQWALILSVIYLIIDVVGTLRHKRPHGDFSGQWMIHCAATAIFYLVYFGGLTGLALELGVL